MIHGTRSREDHQLRSARWVVSIALTWCALSTGLVQAQISSSKEYIYLSGRVIAVESGYNYFASIPTPELLYATNKGKEIEVKWCISAYTAANFEIERIPGGTMQVRGGEGCQIWHDGNVSSGSTYAYRVRAKSSLGNVSRYSNSYIANWPV